MSLSPFSPKFSELPSTLPVFPLQHVIVMPGAELPLNIFEPRYLRMVDDAMRTHRMIGMVQPDPLGHGDPLPLYGTGCAGRITSYSETTDGRIVLTLTGLIRFHVKQELSSIRGYRVVIPGWEDFASDLNFDSPEILDRGHFVEVLHQFLQERNLEVDWQALEQLSDMTLVHILATLLPLDGADKQTILETMDLNQRADALLASLEISSQQGGKPLRH